MGSRGAPQKQNGQAGAMLHSIKVWLGAPVVFGRQAGGKTVRNAPERGHLFFDTSAAALVLHVCWLSILLGLAIQISLLAVSAAFGRSIKLNPLIVDFAQRITWSTIVCSSISVAMAASKMRESFMGLAGLIDHSIVSAQLR